MRNIILDIFELFEHLKRTDEKMIIPRITTNWQIKYEQLIPVNNSTVENFVLEKLMFDIKIEDNRKQLLSKITIALNRLNDLELKVFHNAFYENKNDYEISKIVHYCDKKVKKIKKSACIKFLSCLGLDNQCLKNEDVSLTV